MADSTSTVTQPTSCMCKSSFLVSASALPWGRANYTALAGTAGRHLPLVRTMTSHPHAAWCVRQLRAHPASGGGAVRTRHHGHLTEGDVQAGHAPYDSTTEQAASTTGITLSDGERPERTRAEPPICSATRSLWRSPDAVPNRVICAQPCA